MFGYCVRNTWGRCFTFHLVFLKCTYIEADKDKDTGTDTDKDIATDIDTDTDTDFDTAIPVDI